MLQSIKNLGYYASLGGIAGATLGFKIGTMAASDYCGTFFAEAATRRWLGILSEKDLNDYRELMVEGNFCRTICLFNLTFLNAGIGATCGLIYGAMKEYRARHIKQNNDTQRQYPKPFVRNVNKIAQIMCFTAAGYAIGNFYGSYNAIAHCALSRMQHPAQYERCLDTWVTPPSLNGAIAGACLGVGVVALSILKNARKRITLG